MPKVWNKRDPNCPKDAVYVGRPSKWGNEFVIGRDGTREEVIQKYSDLINQDPAFLQQIEYELGGKDLVCWCAPKPCHADLLLSIANDDPKTGDVMNQLSSSNSAQPGHFIEKCSKCGVTISQCRCASKDKAVINSICKKCREIDCP